MKTILPDRQKEQKLFLERDLQYKRDESQDIGMWDRFVNWLMETLFGGKDTGTKQLISNIITWTLVGIAVGVVIWLLTKTQFGNFIRGKVSRTEFSFSDVAEDIRAIDFETRIREAVASNDLRLAIRWHYLKQLNALNSKGLIGWQPFKTNIDYSNELAKNPVLRKMFDKISNIYDHVWYGKYDITKDDFSKLEVHFGDFEKSI